MEIRRAQKKDVEGILKLLVQVNMVHHVGRPDLFKGPTTKYSKEELNELILQDDKPIFVCVQDEEVLGHAFCVFQEHKGERLLEDCKTLYIDDICVDECARGKHIGTALFRFVKQYAASVGCHNLTLNVWEGNDAAAAFYRSMGMHTLKTSMELII